MASTIQLEPSRSPYRVTVTLGRWTVTFVVHWNARDLAWFCDLYDQDSTIIVLNAKIVLGVNIGRMSNHAFFDDFVLRAIDSTNKGKDATFDDIGRRVQLVATDLLRPFDP